MQETGLYQKYRPKDFPDVVGQSAAVAVLESLFAGKTFPRAILFTGGSGVGKTTLARIMRRKLGCKPSDCFEQNCADYRGIDAVREIRSMMNLRPLTGGACRIWILDECHQQTGDGSSALLKLLEDAPPHVYFFLCTTHPQKLLPTIRTRCTTIELKPVGANEIRSLVERVAGEESADPPLGEEVLETLSAVAEGSPRRALVLLESVLNVRTEAERLSVLKASRPDAEAFDLCRALMDGRVNWAEVASVLRGLEGDAEDVRRAVLGYAQKALLSEKPNPARMARAYAVIAAFRYDLYASGKPGLVAACWEAVQAAK